MKVAVDARELEGRRTGVGRYLHEVLCAWSRSPDAHRHAFSLYSATPIDLAPYAGLDVSATTARGHGVLWEQLTLPLLLRRDRVDVLLAPGYTSPLWGTTPTALVVHDVSFAAHPEWFSWREGARRRTFTRLAARRAARVVTVSRFSKAEIEGWLGITAAGIDVIPNGVTRVAASGPAPLRPATVLYAGSIFNRRHVPELIEAVAILVARGRDVRLEVVGENRTAPRIDLGEHARSVGIADRVTLRSYVSDAELADCYGRARTFAFLSEYEGFGLTPLEALSAGVPIVVLDSPTTREVYDACAMFVSRPRPADIATALESALFDERERTRVLGGAEQLLERYSWSRTAARLLEVLESVGGFSGSPHAII